MISSTCSLCKVKQELISLLVIAVEGNGMNGYCVVHLYLSNDGFGWLQEDLEFYTLSMKQASYSICYVRNIEFFFGQILYNLKF